MDKILRINLGNGQSSTENVLDEDLQKFIVGIIFKLNLILK